MRVIAMAKFTTTLPAKAKITHWSGSQFGTISPKALPAPFLPLDAKHANHYTLTPMSLDMIRTRHRAMNVALSKVKHHSHGHLSVEQQLKLAKANFAAQMRLLTPTHFPTDSPTHTPTPGPTPTPSKVPTSKPTWYYPTPKVTFQEYGVHSQTIIPTKMPTWMPTCVQGNDPRTGGCLPTHHPTLFPTPSPTLRPTRARERMPWQKSSEIDDNYVQQKRKQTGGTDDDVMNVIGDDD